MNKILITGATGQLGKLVVTELLKKVPPTSISVMVRDAQKVTGLKDLGIQILSGDYTHYQSLVAAFQHTEKLYFISSSSKTDRFGQHTNVIRAAAEAHVGHIFYTSAHRKSDDESSLLTGDAHWQTDALMKQSGLKYTILKHSLYMELLPFFMGDDVLRTGLIALPAGEGKSTYVTRQDLAAAAAELLTTCGHDYKTYNLSSPVSYSFTDIAAVMSELSGTTISYADLPEVKFAEKMSLAGHPEKLLKGTLLFCNALKKGEFDFPSSDLEKLLNRKPESVKSFLKQAYDL